jgi:hypothetical protein
VAGIVTLSSQPLMEEGMEELRKVACHAHDTPPSVAFNTLAPTTRKRSLACCRSSWVMVR